MSAPTAYYKWKEGARVSAPPETAGPWLEKFLVRDGTAPGLLAEAKKARAPGWLRKDLLINIPDAELAEEQRLERARLMLRSIEIVRVGSPPRRMAVAIHRVTEPAQVYTSRPVVLSNPELRAQLVKKAEADLRAFHSAYGDMTEFAGIIGCIAAYFASPPPSPPRKRGPRSRK